jgi:hypothetical protein
MVTATILSHEANKPRTANDHHTMVIIIRTHAFTSVVSIFVPLHATPYCLQDAAA